MKEAVTEAERLWSEALSARKLAEQLALEAERAASAAADASSTAVLSLESSKLESVLSGASPAVNQSLSAGPCRQEICNTIHNLSIFLFEICQKMQMILLT